MSLRVLTGPSVEPVTLAEARLWARVDDDDTTQDAMIQLLITAMRKHAENLTCRYFASRTLELRLPHFTGTVIKLPYPPLRSVEYVAYIDGDGVLQTMSGGSPTEFDVDIYSEPGIVRPLYGESWPSTRSTLDAVRIGYTAGYATTNAIPKAFRVWMQARIATLYDNREHLVMNNVVAIPRDFADGLLDALVTGERIAG